jgi:hypothetical protein
MHRVGRDNQIIHFNGDVHNSESIIILCYGEVDCRCHIQRQIDLGREEDDIIYELVTAYFNTIKNSIITCKKVLVCAIIPPTNQEKYERIHGPITHEFPFVGSDEDRIRFTRKMNQLIQHKCTEYNYIFFDPYAPYCDEQGCLNRELSDTTVHVKETRFVLEQLQVHLTDS